MKRLLVVIDNNFKLLYNKFVDNGQAKYGLRLRVVRFCKKCEWETFFQLFSINELYKKKMKKYVKMCHKMCVFFHYI